MKKIFLIIAIIFNYIVNAQECGTPSSSINKVYNIAENFDAQFCINVKFHIVRESDGSGGFDSQQIQNLINYINTFYNPHSINVTSIGFDYINNSTLFNIDDTAFNSSEFDQLVKLNNVPNAINFYIVNSAVSYSGRAQGILSNSLVVKIDRIFATTSPHEVGHCLNLFHTHRGTPSIEPNGCAESLNSSNCNICGDLVCDTPPDRYEGATNGYSPDLTNIMSYYNNRNHFTQQQGARMRNAIAGSPILQQILSSQCASLNGPSHICKSTNYEYTFSNPQSSSITWTVSSGLQIISSSNTNITVKSNSNLNFSTETIKATFPSGATITRFITVGNPKPYLYGVNCLYEPGNYAPCVINDLPHDGGRVFQSLELNSIFTNIQNGDWEWEKPANSRFNFNNIPGNSSTGKFMTINFINGIPERVEFKCRIKSVCGYSEWQNYQLNFSDGRPLPVVIPPPSEYYIISPNPTNSVFNISLKNPTLIPQYTNGLYVSVYTSSGALVMGETYIYGVNGGQINVSNLPNMGYIVRIRFGNNITESKYLIKN